MNEQRMIQEQIALNRMYAEWNFFTTPLPASVLELSTQEALALSEFLGVSEREIDWFTDLMFRIKHPAFGPKDVLWIMIQIAVCDPQNCDCGHDQDGRDREAPGWMRKRVQHTRDHRNRNGDIFRVINGFPGLREKLRRVVRRDIATARPDGDELWGRMMRTSYAQGLLDNFLVPRPTWC